MMTNTYSNKVGQATIVSKMTELVDRVGYLNAI